MGKRGRKTGKDRKGYFYETEEQAVIDYVSSQDKNEKNKIYNEYLQPAFTKMIESIIRRYNLYLPDEIFQETFDDTLSFLLTKIEHFNPNSGFKAYSYCGTICKNYLILKNLLAFSVVSSPHSSSVMPSISARVAFVKERYPE